MSEQAIEYNENLAGGSMTNDVAAFVPGGADGTMESETVDQTVTESDWIDSTPAPSSETVESSNKGVGGWLLFLCVGLTILSPLGTLFNFIVSYEQISRYASVMSKLSGLLVIDGILSTALVAFSIHAGLALWRVQPGAVRIAKQYLLWFLAYQVVAVVLVQMVAPAGASSHALNEAAVTDIARALFSFSVWYSYLSVSKRVRATYTS